MQGSRGMQAAHTGGEEEEESGKTRTKKKKKKNEEEAHARTHEIINTFIKNACACASD